MTRIWSRFTNDVTAANPDYGPCTGIWGGTCFARSPRGGHHVKEYDDGHCSSVLSAGFLGLTVWQLNHLTWSITDYRVRVSSNLEKGLMLSKAKSKAWQLLIEDSNRPAEEIRLATGLRVDVIEQMRGDVQKRLRDNPEF